MYCNKCGNEIKDGAKFCTICGASAAGSQTLAASQEPEKLHGSENKKLILGIGSAAAVLILGIASALLFRTDSENKLQTEQKAGQQTAEQGAPEAAPQSAAVEESSEIVKKTGFVEQDDRLYYYDSDGEPATGWFEENGSRYYAGPENVVIRDEQFMIDGIWHFFDENGVFLGDENSYAREDASLLESVRSGNMENLMSTIAYRYVEGGDTTYSPQSSADVQEEINSLLHGEHAGIDRFFCVENPPASYLNYTRNNRPSEINIMDYDGDLLSKEQIEYLIYSVCGKQMDLNLDAYDSLTKMGSYYQFGGAAGDMGWGEIGNASVERVDHNTWTVQVDAFFGWGDVEDYNRKECMDNVASIDFTVIRNSDSCFDGFSITDAQVELVENVDAWSWLYLDYLDSHPNDSARYRLFYMDNDNIPELFVWDIYVGEVVILTVDNEKGELHSSETIEFLDVGCSACYIERQNFVDISRATGGMSGGGGNCVIYKIVNQTVCQAEYGNYEYENIYDGESYDNLLETVERYWWNNTEISESAYYDQMRQNETKALDIDGYSYEEMKSILSDSTSQIRWFMIHNN